MQYSWEFSWSVGIYLFFKILCKSDGSLPNVCDQDPRVKELAQDLAERLDLKTRKAYIGVQVSNVSAQWSNNVTHEDVNIREGNKLWDGEMVMVAACLITARPKVFTLNQIQMLGVV